MAINIRRIVLNPRAYLTPFVLLLIVHHLPLLISYAVIQKPAGYAQCDPVRYLFRWFTVAFIAHLTAVALILASISITLCSPVYRVRKPETLLILLVFVHYIGNLYWSIYGESAYPADTSLCANDSDAIQQAADDITKMQHFDFVFSIVVVCLASCTSYLCGVHTSTDILEAEQRWQLRCMRMFRLFTCKSSRAHATDEDIFQSLGRILGKFFVVRYKTQKYQGLQFNDLMFCLELVSRAQQEEREQEQQEIQDQLEEQDEPARHHHHLHHHHNHQQYASTQIEEAKLRDLTFYGRLAVGMYGWPMFVWYTPLKWFKIFDWQISQAARQRARATTTEQQVIDHDNLVTSNRASFLNYTGVSNDALVYLNCYNFVFSSPYSIVKDQQRKELIISVRGSFSFYDFVTDGLAHIVNMEPHEVPHDVPDVNSTATHYGMLRTARTLFNDLQEGSRKPLFWDFALEHCVNTVTTNSQETQQAEEPWTIVVCGHSMGAGVGAVLCVLLKTIFPATRAFLYAPPMLFDPVTAQWTKSFMTTAVYGDDIVPRLSIANVTRLRDEMIGHFNAVAAERLIKVKYANRAKSSGSSGSGGGSGKGWFSSSGRSWRSRRVAKLDVVATGTTEGPASPSPPPSEGEGATPIQTRDDRADTQTHTGLLGMDFLETADSDDVQEVDVPGEIVHIQTATQARTCSCTVLLGEQPLTYTIRDASYFRRIWTTSRAIQDHMVHHYDRNIRHLVTNCLGYSLGDDDARVQVVIQVAPDADDTNRDDDDTVSPSLHAPSPVGVTPLGGRRPGLDTFKSYDQIGDFETASTEEGAIDDDDVSDGSHPYRQMGGV